MKIAYIILCHKNARQINMLTKELLKNDSEIFIHIDLKSNIEKDIIKNNHIHILPKEDSYSINWGSNNMILATLSLINYVKKSNINFDYIWLLSGQDYPIMSTEEIEQKLISNKGKNYIDVIDKDSKEYKRYLKLYELWYPSWITKNKTIIKIIKRLYMLITGGFNYTFPIFRRKRKFKQDFYFGSQWWTLTSECVFYILDYCNKNKDYIDYFEHSIIPDECFFQTLFMNSKYKNTKKDNLTFVNWKSNRRSPETLTKNDYKILKDKSKEKCFARKFDIDVDEKIINKI